MHVFVDESGDMGFKFEHGSSKYYSLVAIVFPDTLSADDAREKIRRYRVDLGWKPTHEFKFNRTDVETRLDFLSIAKTMNFEYHGFVLNKPMLFANALRQPNQMYAEVTRWIFENTAATLRHAHVTFDKCADHKFYKFLDGYLRRVMAAKSKHDEGILSVTPKESNQDELLQLADMVVGSMSRFYSDKPDARFYLTRIKKREASLRFWPPDKKKQPAP